MPADLDDSGLDYRSSGVVIGLAGNKRSTIKDLVLTADESVKKGDVESFKMEDDSGLVLQNEQEAEFIEFVGQKEHKRKDARWRHAIAISMGVGVAQSSRFKVANEHTLRATSNNKEIRGTYKDFPEWDSLVVVDHTGKTFFAKQTQDNKNFVLALGLKHNNDISFSWKTILD